MEIDLDKTFLIFQFRLHLDLRSFAILLLIRFWTGDKYSRVCLACARACVDLRMDHLRRLHQQDIGFQVTPPLATTVARNCPLQLPPNLVVYNMPRGGG